MWSKPVLDKVDVHVIVHLSQECSFRNVADLTNHFTCFVDYRQALIDSVEQQHLWIVVREM